MSVRSEAGPYSLFILAVSIFGVLALSARTVLQLDADTHTILAYADDALCILFFVDFLLSLHRAENRWRYFRRWGWLDLASCIPMVDALRWGRLGRILRIFRVLRGLRSASILGRFIVQRRAESSLLAAVLLTILLIVISSISVLQVETVPEANIRSPEDALWWSITTITTVGYGDRYPVTSEGRVLASLLMLCGLGLFGTLSGFVASWFLQPAAKHETEDIQRLLEEVRRQTELLHSLGAIGSRNVADGKLQDNSELPTEERRVTDMALP
jgi:voltage-gated potassium channel